MRLMFNRRRKQLGCNIPKPLSDIAALGHVVVIDIKDELCLCARCGARGMHSAANDRLHAGQRMMRGWGNEQWAENAVIWCDGFLGVQWCLGCNKCTGAITFGPTRLCTGSGGERCANVLSQYRVAP